MIPTGKRTLDSCTVALLLAVDVNKIVKDKKLVLCLSSHFCYTELLESLRGTPFT